MALPIACPLFCGLFLALAPGAADAPADNPEMKRICDADQADRAGPDAQLLDWAKIAARDAGRRQRVRELIEANLLRTGVDYERAALVFQHGEGADDILLAHVLAVTALGKGDRDARWLAAATLDRFLQRAGRPQVFGTQFSYSTVEGVMKWTAEPYDRALIPPGVREANCVPDLDSQREAIQAFQKGQEPPRPKREPCAEPAAR